MGRRVAQRRRPVRAWIARNWEPLLIAVPITAIVSVMVLFGHQI